MTADRTLFAWLAAITLTVGCGSTTPTLDAARDSAPTDAATMSDATTMSDAATMSDVTMANDVTTVSDAATVSDVAIDAATRDGSTRPDSATDAATDASAIEGPSCDARRVLCDRIPPVCAMGEAPSVAGACWGPCIPATMCVCTSNEECPNIPGYSEVCYRTRMRCGPLL